MWDYESKLKAIICTLLDTKDFLFLNNFGGVLYFVF